MKHQCIIMFTCAAALLTNAFSAPQDIFKIGFLSSGIKFNVINVRTNESRLVAAVRETSGQYYLSVMSRMPEFNNKLLTGYFDYDSLSMTGWDSVFITVAIVGDVPQDTFRVGGGAEKFPIINYRTNETRLVAAVRETNGQYYVSSMSRMPEFYNKLLTGYFSYDSLYNGKWDSVFVTVAIVGDITSVGPGQAVKKNVMAAGIQHRARAFQYDLRGCRVERPAGMALSKENGRIRKSIDLLN
jgi:mRNA-degrading endonuclease HigB of HigAB toxin-antitoxin module